MRPLNSLIAGLMLLAGPTTFAEPLGTFFTLQGELQDMGTPVDGSVDFEFEPFDAASGGTSLTPSINRTVLVQDGVFTTTLDFGDLPFMGEAVWVEVRINEPGGGVVTLSPRQRVTPTPYAIHALFVGDDAVSSAQVVDGSLAGADLATGAVGLNQINSAQVQRRVASSCPAGSAIREVAQDGSVTCQANEADDDWLPLGDGRLQNTTGIRVQPVAGTLFPLTIRHDSGINTPTVALVESTSDFARLSFYSDPNPSFWTIAAASAADVDDDILNIFNSAVGDIFTVRGNQRVGIRNTNPQATLHVSGGDVRVDALAHAGPDPIPVFIDSSGTLVPEPSGTATSQYLSIGANAFKTTDSSIDYRVFASLAFPAGTSGTLAAPIQLRDGEVMEEITVYYRDNSSTSNLTVFLLSGGLGGNSAAVLTSLTTSGASTAYRSDSVNVTSSGLINNQTSRYYINVIPTASWTGTSDLGIQAVVIRFR